MQDISNLADSEALIVEAGALVAEIQQRARDVDMDERHLKRTQARVQGVLAQAARDDGASSSIAVRRAVANLGKTWRKNGPALARRISELDDQAPHRELCCLLRLVRVEMLELRATGARVRNGKAPIADVTAFARAIGGQRRGDGASAEALALRSLTTRFRIDELGVAETDVTTGALPVHRGGDHRTVDDLLTEAEELVAREASLRRFSDDVRHLREHWEQIHETVDALHGDGSTAPGAEQAMGALENIEVLCRDVVFIIGWRTIPERLQRWLD